MCGGMGYRVEPEVMAEVIANLDHREKNGYRRILTPLFFDGGTRPVEALLYLAGPNNPHYAGPAPVEEIAAVVRQCRGPSGENVEYVLELAGALAELGYRDLHVEELARLITP
jgi:glutathione-specific gamma-glutamylcyclotransferase